MAAQYKRTNMHCRPEKGFFKTLEDGASVKRGRIRTKRFGVVRLCVNRRATRRKKKQSNVNETDFIPSILGEKKNDGSIFVPLETNFHLKC